MSKIRPTKIGQLQLVVLPYQYVLRLYISMDNFPSVNILNSTGNLENILSSLNLLESFVWTLHESFEQLSFLSILKNKINGEVVFKMVVEFDDVGMVQFVHHLYLGLYMTD
jgi:hypothetical protein